jgi:glycosyltransferase involved in cell wall biosynthesis
VAGRLAEFNGVAAEVLFPPVWRPERYRKGPFGDYVLYLNRMNPHKRQELAIEAMRYTETPVRLVLAGKPDPGTERYAGGLARRISEYGLEGRVHLLGRWVREEDKIGLLAGCLGVGYFPYLEDSYGYPSLEAYHSGKPVITTTDAGGTSELIIGGKTGLVTPPEAREIARAFDGLYRDRAMAAAMGAAGEERIGELDITWDRVERCLLR